MKPDLIPPPHDIATALCAPLTFRQAHLLLHLLETAAFGAQVRWNATYAALKRTTAHFDNVLPAPGSSRRADRERRMATQVISSLSDEFTRALGELRRDALTSCQKELARALTGTTEETDGLVVIPAPLLLGAYDCMVRVAGAMAIETNSIIALARSQEITNAMMRSCLGDTALGDTALGDTAPFERASEHKHRPQPKRAHKVRRLELDPSRPLGTNTRYN
jgi:hypothetical protein